MALNIFKFFLKEPPAPEVHVLFYNTLGRAKEHFVPLKAGRVSMYHCGPTVYGYTHIGHAREYVFADLIKRLFLYQGLTVNQIINITDVGHLTDDEDQGQDKIEEGARRENKTAKEIVELYTNDFMENLSKLNVDTDGTIFPKASEHILEQIAFIKTLEEKGYTYPTSDGIYFDTSRFPDYGKLGNIDLKGLEEGKRVAINAEKKHPTDFALWKFSKPEEKRQQEWESPWGKGFPGWHIECSAMSTKYLGHRFDIHTGGVDHIPVHHNNEIAQSNCALGVKSVNYWMHSEHLRIDGKKISKSLGNVILLKHVEERNISPLAYRYWLLTSHYRTPINFTWEALEAAHRGFYRLQKAFVEDLGVKKGSINATYRKTFSDALADDIDTPKAIATLWNLLKDTGVSKPDKKATLLDFDKVLGLGLSTAQEFLEGNKKEIANSDIPPEVENLLTERERARLAKDFKKADELRDKIKAAGFEISDTPDGAKLQKV